MRGVSLEEISAATRISTRFLQALENEHWSELPGGVFNRGFIRSVARFLGLDEDSFLAEYELETSQQPEVRAVAHPPAEMPRQWRPLAVAVAVLVLVIAGGWFAYRHYRSRIGLQPRNQSVAAPASAPSSPGQQVENGASAVAPSPSGQANQAAGSSQSNGQPASAAPGKVDALHLKMETTRSADVRVIADGKTALDGPIASDSLKFFDAKDSIEITSSDASAVLLELNGRSIPFNGVPGQPASITLTPKDLTPEAGGSH